VTLKRRYSFGRYADRNKMEEEELIMNIDHPEIFHVPEDRHQVACDGGGGLWGIPRFITPSKGRVKWSAAIATGFSPRKTPSARSPTKARLPDDGH